MDTRRSTWAIVETINEGEEGEKVTLCRIASGDTAFSIAVDDMYLDGHPSPEDTPAVVVEGATRS